MNSQHDSTEHGQAPVTHFSRRDLLRVAGSSALAVAVTGLTSAPAQALDLTQTDINILNFALNLEYFEAEFYTHALTGQGIEAIGIATDGHGRAGETVGGGRVNFGDPMLRSVAEELAFDEQQHVKLLRRILGDKAIAKPALNLNARGFGFESDEGYLRLARAMEDVGTSAYVGAADKLSRHLLTTAAGITADEAYHMGNVRLMIAQKNISTEAVDSKDILPPPTGKKFFAVDDLALAIPRTMLEVLPIVRAHFPNGLNIARA